MKLAEVIKKYDLAEFEKTYKNPNGNRVDISLKEIAELDVKDVYINFMTKTATISVLKF